MLRKNEASALRKAVVRQDRISVSPDEICTMQISGKTFQVVNYSSFGLAILAKTDEITPDNCRVSIFFNDIEVSITHVQKVRSESIQDGQTLIGYEVLGEPIAVDLIEIIRDIDELTSKQLKRIDSEQKIPEAFRRQVYELKDWLEELKTGVDSIEEKCQSRSKDEFEQIELTVAQTVHEYMDKHFVPFLHTLFEKIRDYNNETLKLSISFFRDRLKDLIYQAPFAHRSVSKPLGYAGDYEMMNLIYRNELIGPSLFGKALHRYYVMKPAAQAVRNRADYLVMAISRMVEKSKPGEKIKILSVASGPAVEVQKLISEVQEYNHLPIEFYFLDQDMSALKYSQRKLYELKLKHGCKFEFIFLNKNIKTVIGRGLHEEGLFDLIYCAGVFDYFTDPVAQLAAQRLFESVKSHGELIIGNFSDDNPNEIEMKFFLDWDLIYRSPEDLERLFGALNGTLKIEKESKDINLFCTISKDTTDNSDKKNA